MVFNLFSCGATKVVNNIVNLILGRGIDVSLREKILSALTLILIFLLVSVVAIEDLNILHLGSSSCQVLRDSGTWDG